MEIRTRQLLSIAERTGATPSPEALHDMLKELLPWKRVFKIIQVTPRLESASPVCFELFWFNIEPERAGELHRAFTNLARANFKDTDEQKQDLVYPPEEVTFYLQPLEFGRTGMLELDAFPNQGEPEGVKRGLKMGVEAITMILEHGGSSTGLTGESRPGSAGCRPRCWGPITSCSNNSRRRSIPATS